MKKGNSLKLWFGICMAIMLVGLSLMAACAQQAQPATTTAATTTKPATTTATTPAATTTTKPASTTPTPLYGGIFKIISAPGLSNLGLIPGDSTDRIIARPCMENLVGMNPDGSGDPYPQLATSWQYSPNYDSLTMNLRKNVKFHDGTDFNAEAAKFCLDMFRNSSRAELSSVSSIDIIDNYTIRLNLSVYEPAFLIKMHIYRAGMMASPTALKAKGEDNRFNPVGTGPFKFVSYQRDTSLKFERFDGYWGGKPYLDGIEWVFIKDPVTQLLSFKSGEAQSYRRPTANDLLDLQKTGQYDITIIPGGLMGFVPDGAHTTSHFADIRVRQAVAYALDRNAIAKTVGVFNTGLNQFAVKDVHWYYNPAVVGYPYNPQKAKELLTQAGYPNGFSTSIQIEAIPNFQTLATLAQSYLGDVGIQVKVDGVTQTTALNTRLKGWSDGLVMIMYSSGFDPTAALTSQISSKSSYFDTKSLYIPADYDAKLAQASIERDTDKRKTMVLDLEKMIIDQYCFAIPVYVSNGGSATSLKVHDFDMNKPYDAEWTQRDLVE